MNRIRGRRILITGASAGIGEACARTFAQAGADLILVSRRIARLESLREELTMSQDVDIRIGKLDVRDRQAIDGLATLLEEQDFSPDVLINNAGLARGLHTAFRNRRSGCDSLCGWGT